MVKINENYTDSNADLVFAIEATANMVAHYEQIKKNYISPILNHFDTKSSSIKSPNELINYSTTSRRFVLVLFTSADNQPGYTTECFPPTESKSEFLQTLDLQLFTGGASEQFSHVTEGLATSLQAFNDLAAERQSSEIDSKCDRFCFLISNSPPYQQNCTENYEYYGMTLQQLGEKFYDKDIKLSIICPRHINQLRLLYMTASPQTASKASNLLNYAQDRRHLVLISGFAMPTDREPHPLVDEQQQDSTGIQQHLTAKTEPMTLSEQHGSDMHYSNIDSSASMVSTNSSSTIGSLPDSFNSGVSGAGGPPRKVKILNNQVPTSSTSDPFKVVRPNITSSYVNKDMENRTKPIVSGAATSNMRPVQMGPAQKPAEYEKARKEADKIVHMLKSNPQVIWKGHVEWTERVRPPQFQSMQQARKITKMSQCVVYQQMNGLPEVSTTHWQPKFSLTFVAAMYMNNLKDMMKPKANLIFSFNNSQVAPQLAENFQKQYGVVTLFTKPSNAEPKHAFILCSQNADDKYLFPAFVPDNSSKILEAMRKLYDKVHQQGPPRFQPHINRQQQLVHHQQQQQQQQTTSNGMMQSQSRVNMGGGAVNHQQMQQQVRNTADMQQRQQQQHSMQQQSPHGGIQLNSNTMSNVPMNPMSKSIQQHSNLQQQQQQNPNHSEQLRMMSNRAEMGMSPMNRQNNSVISTQQMQQQQQQTQLYQQQQQHNMLPSNHRF